MRLIRRTFKIGTPFGVVEVKARIPAAALRKAWGLPRDDSLPRDMYYNPAGELVLRIQ